MEDPVVEDPIVEDPVVEDPIVAPNIECPTGYVAVPSNSDVGVDNGFCVMKYEAKNDGSGNPISQAEATPWVSINQADTKAACRSLNTEMNDNDIDNDTGDNGTYDLISNPEWMTIARNIENVDSNWTSGTKGTGCLFRGNVGATLPCDGPSTDQVNSGYDGLNPHFGLGRSETAKLTLDNGEEVWDLAGNIREWVDWSIAKEDLAYVEADGGPTATATEFKTLDINIGQDDVMSPETWQATDPTLDSTNGIGIYSTSTIGQLDSAASRSSDWDDKLNAGLFTLVFSLAGPNSIQVGFRCVYRP